MKVIRYVLGAAYLLFLWSNPTIAQQKDLSGRYVLDAAASDDVQAAINAGTADMSILIRSIARSRTAETNPQYEHIAIVHNDGSVSVQFDQRSPLEMSLNGSATSWTREDGGHYDVTAIWSGAKLVMYCADKDGDRTNTFRLDPDGKAMRLSVELKSSHFSAPIRYTLVYERL